jgi:hypothetical protein
MEGFNFIDLENESERSLDGMLESIPDACDGTE